MGEVGYVQITKVKYCANKNVIKGIVVPGCILLSTALWRRMAGVDVYIRLFLPSTLDEDES
jgi:hypothetical protein